MVELGRDVVQHIADRVEAVGRAIEVIYTSGAAGAICCRVALTEGDWT